MATAKHLLRGRLVALIGLSFVLAAACAVLNSGIVGGIPPKPQLHKLDIAAATSHINVDLPANVPGLVIRQGTPPEDVRTLVRRGELMGRVIASQPVLTRIEKRCGIPAGQLSGMGRITANVPIALTEPDSERRASEIAASQTPYRLEVQSRPMLPIVDVYTEAPTVAMAECEANAAAPMLLDYLRSLAAQKGEPGISLMDIQPLGPARGSIANSGAGVEIAFLTFITVFGICLAGLFAISRLRRRGRPSRRAPVFEDATDNWPHTSRMLPWMFAGFLAVIWLTPFNNIQLDASLPIELRLDRLVLPFVVIVWFFALAAGGAVAPRLRMTWVHVALGGLLACAFLSVVTDARYLNQTLEFSLSLKKLPLMVSYVSVFVIAASAIRKREVDSFMTYTLALAVIVALGMIWEYRMKVNLFWDLSDKLLPGMFTIVGSTAADVTDGIGRRMVRGPAEVPLEAVAMLTMGLTIALVRVIHATRPKQRLIYGAAICLLFAAMFATYRKSALIAPVSVLLTLAYFRRGDLLKLAPLGMVALVIITAAAPGAMRSTVSQFTRSDATSVPTVDDRTSDYDAIRPDVLSHLALGRGWGSYNHQSYRILDSEILQRLIETGVLGLVVFLLVPAVVVYTARKPIALRDPVVSPIALIGAMVAVGFAVAATLFDELSFPHAAYIFLYMVGLVTVMLPSRDGPPAAAGPDELERSFAQPAFDGEPTQAGAMSMR